MISNHDHGAEDRGGKLVAATALVNPGTITVRDVADGAVAARRLLAIDAIADLVQAGVDSNRVAGINQENVAKIATDPIEVAIGRVTAIADGVIDAGLPLKSGNGGRPLQFVDSALAGSVIDSGAGGNFGNQPANDGVEVLSSAAGDTTQNVTITGTTFGTETVVQETVALNGTTVVATVKTDWGEILAVELDAAAVGTVTVREASADLTITTLAPAVLTAGIIEVPVADQRAFNQPATLVGDGATTAIMGIIGTDVNHGAQTNNAIALNGATPVTLPTPSNLITRLLVGSVASGVSVTAAVGAQDDPVLKIGRALAAAAAQDNEVAILLLP